jgi:hypothetical protein
LAIAGWWLDYGWLSVPFYAAMLSLGCQKWVWGWSLLAIPSMLLWDVY